MARGARSIPLPHDARVADSSVKKSAVSQINHSLHTPLAACQNRLGCIFHAAGAATAAAGAASKSAVRNAGRFRAVTTEPSHTELQ